MGKKSLAEVLRRFSADTKKNSLPATSVKKRMVPLSSPDSAVLAECFDGVLIEINPKTHKILSCRDFSRGLGLKITGSSFIADLIVHDRIHFDEKSLLGAFSDKLYSSTLPEPVYARVKNAAGEFVWCCFSLSVVKASEGEPRLLCCIKNCDVEKRIIEEQREAARRYFSVLAASCDTIVEIDLTEDRIVSQDDVWRRNLGVEEMPSYSSYIESAAADTVFGEDAQLFRKTFSLESLLSAYSRGKTTVSLEYRIYIAEKTEWHSCTMCLIEDRVTGHIRAVVYIKNITEKKIRELEVVNLAERDSLTRLYNKRTVQLFIEDFLNGDGAGGHHALFIIDLDNFKAINDNFGHPFGDAVLSEISERISVIFRTSDIIGRIGGDEFLVFAKNIQIETIHQKARQLVERLRTTYTASHNSYTVSGSVGICCFPEDGSTYGQLYENADTALYSVKKERKNSYSLFNSGLVETKSAGISLARENDFDTEYMLNQKSFNENLADYIFKILYESKNTDEGISLVLALIGKRYKADRAYVFLDSDDDRVCSNTHEWCAEGVIPQKDELQEIPYEQLGDYQQNFNTKGFFLCRDIKNLHPDVYDFLSQQGVKSLIQCAIMDSNIFKGFIGFDYCREKITENPDRMETLLTVSRMLGVFLLKARMRTAFENSLAIQDVILSDSKSNVYVIDIKTMRVLYADKKLEARVKKFPLETPCHQIFFKLTERCSYCPAAGLAKKSFHAVEFSDSEKHEAETYTARKISWSGTDEACLICRTSPDYTQKDGSAKKDSLHV